MAVVVMCCYRSRLFCQNVSSSFTVLIFATILNIVPFGVLYSIRLLYSWEMTEVVTKL